MNYNNFKLISEMGLKDNRLVINNDTDFVYVIDSNIKVDILENVNVCILDKSNNSSVDINVGLNSNLKYYVLDSNSTNKTFNILGNVEYLEINISKNESNITANLNNEYARFDARTLSMVNKLDNKFITTINHNAKNTWSNVNNTGVAYNGANLLFDVTGKVSKGMSKSDCHQLTRGVILDDISSVSAKPVLLIDEYDCMAGHGAAIGNVRDEDLFYLMSRGLNRVEAYKLILKGVVNPFILDLPFEEYRDSMLKRIEELF